MSTLGTLVANSLWFAFDALDHHKTGFVPKSQLKVLTQNIGVLLKIDRRVEESLKDFFSYTQLSFEQFLDFLSIEVFPEVDGENSKYNDLKQYHKDLDTIFWDLSKPSLGVKVQILSDTALFKIFRIFCLLADRGPDYEYLVQVTMTRGEVEEVTRRLIIELGREFDQLDFRQLAESIPPFNLPVLATFLEGRYLQEVELPAMEMAVDEVYQVMVEQVLEKGKVYHKLPLAPIWIVRDVRLYPWELRPVKPSPSLLQPLQQRFASAPLASLNPSSEVTGVRDYPGLKKCQFMIKMNQKVVELAAMDYRAKTRWLRALDEAIPNSDNPLPYQMILSQQRKELRMFEEVKEVEEKFRRDSQADIIDQTQAELVSERLARVEAEAKREEEALARANGEKQVKELTTLRQQLEELLEQETQAKRDEEIVRNLQARVLREEWEKREELEHLQKEQRALLEAEQKKREAFERIHQDKEEQLKEAQGKLRKLQIERFKLDQELSTTREKIVRSERGQEILEARMKVKQRKPPERAFSLRPPRRDPPRCAPLRSSSFNTRNSIRKTFFPKSDSKKSNGDLDYLKKTTKSHNNPTLQTTQKAAKTIV